VAVGLALAAALSSVRDTLPGSVLFVFQPAEERATGARAMLADGVFSAGTPVAIYGLHTAPFEVGQIATRPGVMMAARDRVRVSVSGQGDAAAALELARAVVQGLSTITRAQALQSQPEGFVFVQIEPAQSGGASIQAQVTVAGREARDRARATLASGLATIHVPGVTVTHEYTDKVVAGVTNDSGLTTAATAALVRAFGQAAMPPLQNIVPGFSEDFGSFQDEVPGVFFFLATPPGASPACHTHPASPPTMAQLPSASERWPRCCSTGWAAEPVTAAALDAELVLEP
jgi:metal-dependent amidase/aminoacylase/carboxypeptidase family protein